MHVINTKEVNHVLGVTTPTNVAGVGEHIQGWNVDLRNSMVKGDRAMGPPQQIQAFPSPLPTPINIEQLELQLQGYDPAKAQFLLDGFKFGFSIGYFGSSTTPNSSNLKSALQQPDVVDNKLKKELAAGRIAGPFLIEPFHTFHCSPLGVVPKKIQGEFRLIHHLSWPHGSSINDGIPHELATVQYARLDDAVQAKAIMHFGQGCYLAKTDIRSAFRIIPVAPSDYNLLGFKWRDRYYYDRCLPMGCASSCNIFEAFSSCLEWMVLQTQEAGSVLHILDDFLFVSKDSRHCKRDLNTFISLCSQLGVPLAKEKN